METKDFSPHVRNEHRRIALERFGMNHGQFFSEYLYKNLFWVLDGDTIGYGDIRMEDVANLLKSLKRDEIFEGFNEHHGSQFQHTDLAILRIANGVLSFPHNNAMSMRHPSRG